MSSRGYTEYSAPHHVPQVQWDLLNSHKLRCLSQASRVDDTERPLPNRVVLSKRWHFSLRDINTQTVGITIRQRQNEQTGIQLFTVILCAQWCVGQGMASGIS